MSATNCIDEAAGAAKAVTLTGMPKKYQPQYGATGRVIDDGEAVSAARGYELKMNLNGTQR